MAKVNWSTGIDSVSGALSKPSKNGQHSCTKMLLATHRVAETTNPNCNRLFLRKQVKRSTMPSSAELDVRERFATVSAAVADRRKDLTKITTDQIAFKAQKDTPGGCRTMTKYLWKIEGDAYDAAHPRS